MKMSTAPVLIQENNGQARVPKNIVPDSEQFNGDRIKFEDQQREIRLFLISNRIMRTDDRIIAILAHLRRGVAGIYAQKKPNELDEKIETQDQDNFVQEIKRTFSDKTKAANTEWKIETFKQGKKNMTDFMISSR